MKKLLNGAVILVLVFAVALFSGAPANAQASTNKSVFVELVTGQDDKRLPGWENFAGLAEELRTLSPSHRVIEIYGGVDVVFRRSLTSQLVVVGSSEAIKQVKTRMDRNLVIDARSVAPDSVSVNTSGGTASVSVADSAQAEVNGQVIAARPHGRVIVGISGPQVPMISHEGSGKVQLFDVNQDSLSLLILGAGDIEAQGRVTHLQAEVKGSGDLDAAGLIVEQAFLLAAGFGNIDVTIHRSVYARINGSGDITIRGNPRYRDLDVTPSGEVKFR